MKVYVIEYLEKGMELMFQIHSVTSSEKYAKELCTMIMDRDDILEAGYEGFDLIDIPVGV